MKTLSISLVTMMSLSVGALDAQVAIRLHDPSAHARPAALGSGLGSLARGVDAPAAFLLVPFYEVDTLDPAGTTTLFGVRNISSDPIQIEIRYLSPSAVLQQSEALELAAGATLSRNVRDVPGLPTDTEGIATGYIGVFVTSMPEADVLVGDYLQVDVDDDFATGERMVGLADVCDEAEVRFLDFGTPTELRFLLDNPQGGDPMTSLPSVEATVLSEAGAVMGTLDIFSPVFSFSFSSEELAGFTGLSFGTLVFDFSNASGGVVYAESSAEGRFSVGLNGACTVP